MENLQKYFVPYKESKELKELGFNEPCLATINKDNYEPIDFRSLKISDNFFQYNFVNSLIEGRISAILWQQAFDWFREEHILFAKVYIVNMGADEYCYDIYDLYEETYLYDNFHGAGASYSGTFNTYEEAQLAALRKLIEIVKERKDGK